MAGNQITLTPEDCRALIVQAVEHAAMAGAYANLPEGLRVRLLAAKDWLNAVPLPAEGPTAEAAPEGAPKTAPAEAERKKKRKT